MNQTKMYKYIESRMGLQKKTADADAEIDDSISHQSRWFSLQVPARVHLCTYYFSTSDLRRFLLQMSMQRRLQWTSGLPQFHRVGPQLKLITSKNNIRHTISVLPGWISGSVDLVISAMAGLVMLPHPPFHHHSTKNFIKISLLVPKLFNNLCFKGISQSQN